MSILYADEQTRRPRRHAYVYRVRKPFSGYFWVVDIFDGARLQHSSDDWYTTHAEALAWALDQTKETK